VILEEIEHTKPIREHPYKHKDNFLVNFGNENFRISKMTYVSFIIIILFVGQSFLGDPSELFANMNEAIRLITYIATIVFLWLLYAIIYFAIVREDTNVRSIGIVKLRTLDFARGLAILLSLYVIAAALTILMATIGFTIPGEVEMFLPQELFGKLMWVAMSFTAGFCEEAVFRGYLMTRIRLWGNFSSWTIPLIVSSLLFGIPHLYQGFAGVVVITVLGAMFGYSYIRYRTIWPAIIAHFFLDSLNLIIPQFESTIEQMLK